MAEKPGAARFSRLESPWAAGFLAATLLLGMPAAQAQEPTAEELAKQLANPIASLISVPIQLNWDDGFGELEGDRCLLNVQPVIPFEMSEDINLISRTILPVINQSEQFPGLGSDSGIGDIVQSVFFSPKAPGPGGLIWGVGPVFLLPTASDEQLGQEKWGAGPTAVGLLQKGPWTYGALANHIWSFAGEDSRTDVNATFIQPFLVYNTPRGRGYFLNLESTYDWETENWSIPVNAGVNQLVAVGDQKLQLTAGVRYWLETPELGPDDWGLRFVATFLFPR